jgi:iron complex transport system substrate-binding protein
VVAVDDIEKKRPQFDARPYSLANPQFKRLPMFGEFRGFDNPELILSLEPAPQVIFKTYPGHGARPVKLQQKTGIPVIILDYGDFGSKRSNLYESLRIMGEVVQSGSGPRRSSGLLREVDRRFGGSNPGYSAW